MGKSTNDVPVIEVGKSGSPGITIATTSFHAEHDKIKNLAKIKTCIEVAADKGARLIVFPEQCLQGYISLLPTGPMPLSEFQYQYGNAETIPGPATDEVTVLAKKYSIYVILGLTERNASYAGGTGALFNSMVLVGPQGVIGIYRKVHLPLNEQHIYVAGTAFNVYDTDIGRIGMHICHDKSFPESSRVLMIKGADIIVHSTAWPKGGPLTVCGTTQEEYSGYISETMERHSAAANEVWFVSSNNFGLDDNTGDDYFGHSRVIHPTGIVIADSGEREAIVVVHGLDIKGEIFRRRTEYFNTVNLSRDRQPSLYSEISEDMRYPSYIPEKGTTDLFKE